MTNFRSTSALVVSRLDCGKGRHVLETRPACNPCTLSRLLDQRQRSRSFANDEDPGFLVLGAVPMHLLAEMGDETAARHGHHIVFVDFVAGCDPPRALDHGDEAIVGMEMRLAEVARLESIEDDVEPA